MIVYNVSNTLQAIFLVFSTKKWKIFNFLGFYRQEARCIIEHILYVQISVEPLSYSGFGIGYINSQSGGSEGPRPRFHGSTGLATFFFYYYPEPGATLPLLLSPLIQSCSSTGFYTSKPGIGAAPKLTGKGTGLLK